MDNEKVEREEKEEEKEGNLGSTCLLKLDRPPSTTVERRTLSDCAAGRQLLFLASNEAHRLVPNANVRQRSEPNKTINSSLYWLFIPHSPHIQHHHIRCSTRYASRFDGSRYRKLSLAMHALDQPT